MAIDFDSNLPIYIQVMDYIKKEIVSGRLKPGDRVDSVRDLALHFRVSPGMMEMMVSKLVDRGDVETVVPTSCCGGDCGCSSEDHGKHYKLTLKAFREMEA